MDKAKVFEALEKLADEHVQKELAELRAFKAAVQNDPDVHSLYWGHYHGDPSAIDLIGATFNMVFKSLCGALNVESYEGYESDGGLDDAIPYDVCSILKEAGVMSRWDNTIARHPADRDAKLEAEYDAQRRSDKAEGSENG